MYFFQLLVIKTLHPYPDPIHLKNAGSGSGSTTLVGGRVKKKEILSLFIAIVSFYCYSIRFRIQQRSPYPVHFYVMYIPVLRIRIH
jgi:hypothetical protein